MKSHSSIFLPYISLQIYRMLIFAYVANDANNTDANEDAIANIYTDDDNMYITIELAKQC